MYYKKEGKEKVLNVTSWLRMMYGAEIKPEIKNVELHQSEDDVWVTVTREIDSDLGTLVTYESFDMSIASDVDEGGFDKEALSFPTSVDIEINAKRLFEDKETVMNVTSIFD